jgi:stalled ribosome rescue protein Dom34
MPKGAKQRWNEKNYTPIKISVRHHIASEFKSVCIEKGESQASVLARAMMEYTGTEVTAQNEVVKKASDEKRHDTRRKRRKVTNDIIKLLHQVLEAEEEYRDSIPESFVNRTETAEQTIDLLTQAIDHLTDAY